MPSPSLLLRWYHFDDTPVEDLGRVKFGQATVIFKLFKQPGFDQPLLFVTKLS